jgi:HemY protein
MTRVVIFLVIVGLIALAKAWVADRPGEVAITWLGWRIETSVMVLTIGLIALVLVSMLLWSILR